MHRDAETTARVGAWLSAALCDPAVCQEMKDDIWAWMKSGQPNVQPAEPADSNNFIQLVPEHCDRILWKGSYYHLPIQPASMENQK